MDGPSTMVVEKSTHKVDVIEIKEILKHENADALSKVKVADYTSIIRTADWKVGDLAAWIPPDNLVDTTRPEFAFLAKKAKSSPMVRIRTEKLRGIVSYGLLVHAPSGSKVGDNVADLMGVLHYDPDISDMGIPGFTRRKGPNVTGGEAAKPPEGFYPVYDVDAFMAYGRLVFLPDEIVALTEKIHGSSSRFVMKNGEIHVGSRGEWKREYPTKPTTTYEQILEHFEGNEEKAKYVWSKVESWKPTRNLWWKSFDSVPTLKKYLQENPDFAVYGETYGNQKGFPYDTNGNHKFRAFDILKPDGMWMDFPEYLDTVRKYAIPYCPVIHEAIPFDFDTMVKFGEGRSLVGDHIREGVVVHPIKERWDERVGRVKFKIINPEY